MKTSQEITGQIQQVKKLVESKYKSEIILNANGGNSILIVCPPEQEQAYIKISRKILSDEKYDFIDINKLLIEFIEKHKEEILSKLYLLQSSLNQVFKSPPGEENTDLFNCIIERIEESFKSGKVPFLFSVGSLYGTGIDNIQIIEHEKVMNANSPLVVLYPAINTENKLLFLNSRPASQYRCMVIK